MFGQCIAPSHSPMGLEIRHFLIGGEESPRHSPRALQVARAAGQECEVLMWR